MDAVYVFGPVHAYVELPTVLDVKLTLLPEQTGELLDATGVDGVGFTVTEVVATALVGQPGTVMLTEYVPAARAVTAAIVGFCTAALKLFGPFHE